MFAPVNDRDKWGRSIARYAVLHSFLWFPNCNSWDSLPSSRLLTYQHAHPAGSYTDTQWATSLSVCMWRTTSPSIPPGFTVRSRDRFSIHGCCSHHIHYPIHHCPRELRKYQISLPRVEGRESFICSVCGDSDASVLHCSVWL